MYNEAEARAPTMIERAEGIIDAIEARTVVEIALDC